ncbi:MAG TPA: glucose-6-phosphate dehydrogenase [Gemmatimonadales bacterium]|nr:glucose-6-phosphate dehydrogenase [Gemmatimonadales bacterium]
MTGTIAIPLQVTGEGPVLPGRLRRADPCIVVIFGANGDLSHRKLIPALFQLAIDGAIPDDFAIIGVDRDALDDATFKAGMRSAAAGVAAGSSGRDEIWARFEARLSYLHGNLDDTATYAALQQRLVAVDATLKQVDGHLFHLALPPSLYGPVIQHLSASGVLPRTVEASQRPWSRVIIEKPFGHDLGSARALNAVARAAMGEHQIFRIDHYLGKETVQNMLVLRFANSIFEPIWNRHHIHHVQITAAEDLGVEHRGVYYEEAGVVRDMFQNHLLQLLTLTAMEPPTAFRADAVRDEKVKVLHAIRPIASEDMHVSAVRGQYGAGMIGGAPVSGYREEPHVSPESNTPTYAAIRFMVDNWRWQGVPFFLRSGKRMPARSTEIAIEFRRPPHLMFPIGQGQSFETNVLVIRIQPSEGVALCFEVKMPGVDMRMASVNMDFDYHDAFGASTHDAYETLLLDCMTGEATLFTRSDEAEAAWETLDPLLAHWESSMPQHFPNYAAGSWGPAVADELIARVGARWRRPAGT